MQEVTIDSALTAESSDGEDVLCLASTLADSHVTPHQQAEHSELKARVEDCLRQTARSLSHRRCLARDGRLFL